MKKTLALLLACAPLLLPSVASASPEYPSIVQTTTGAAKAPECTLCHQDDNGGKGTVITAFGRNLMNKYHLTSSADDTLKRILLGLQAEGSDLDGDGIPDFQELKDGTDPSPPNAGAVPTYGCGATIAPQVEPGRGWLLLLAAFSLGLVPWRRSRSARG